MDQYHVVMFITRQQEMAIRSLFWQHGWSFCCKVLRGDVIIPLLQDYGTDQDVTADIKPYSFYEDIYRTDGTKYYNDINSLTSPDVFSRHADRSYSMNAYSGNLHEQVTPGSTPLANIGWIHASKDGSDIRNFSEQVNVQQENNFEPRTTVISNTFTSSLNSENISNETINILNNAKSKGINNLAKPMDHPQANGNNSHVKDLLTEVNLIQTTDKQCSSKQNRHTVGINLPIGLNKEIDSGLNTKVCSDSVNNIQESSDRQMTHANKDCDITSSGTDLMPVKTNKKHDVIEEVTETLIVKPEDENDISKAEIEGCSKSKEIANGRHPTLVLNTKDGTPTASELEGGNMIHKQLSVETVTNKQPIQSTNCVHHSNSKKVKLAEKKLRQTKEANILAKAPFEKSNTHTLHPEHIHVDNLTKIKTGMMEEATNISDIQIKEEQDCDMLEIENIGTDRSSQLKSRNAKMVMMAKRKNHTSNTPTKMQQNHQLLTMVKDERSSKPLTNENFSKKVKRTDPENHSKRICSKCGKGLGRKKICYSCELTCKYCGKSYANNRTRGRRGLLRIHIMSHEGNKSSICQICGKAFAHIDYMKRHMKLVHVDAENTLVCNICLKKFKNNHTLQIHIRSIHNTPEENLRCDICGSKFRRKGSLMAHRRRVHVDTKSYKCEECGSVWKTSDSLRAHKKKAHGERVRTVCYICGALLLSEDKLKKHFMRHKNQRTFQCMKCEKKFYSSHEVRQHFRTHSGDKPFKCHLCTYASAVKGNLTKHMKIHKTGDSVPKHNYTGHSYTLDVKEPQKMFVKLDDSS